MPITVEATASEAEYRIEDSAAQVIFADTAVRPELEQIHANGLSLPHILYRDGQLMAPADGTSGIALPEEDLHATAFLVYTSGTAGKPKGVELTLHSMLWVNAACWAPIAGLSSDDEILSPLPLFHSYAINIAVLGVLANGATERIMAKFSPGRALDMLEDGEITLLPGVPTMFHYLLLCARERNIQKLGKLRLCISAGAILPAALNRDFEAQFGVPLLDGYGITETSTMVTMNWPGAGRVMGSCGLPVPGVPVRIIDPVTGRDQPRGEEGELICSGPNVMLGYRNKPEETAKVLKDGWYHTGDLARSDNAGFLTITGRLKEVIIRGGQNISPAEVEETLLKHPAVKDVAVVGVPHETPGEVPVAYIVWHDNPASTDELWSHCRVTLAPYKIPGEIRSIDAIPRTGSGKTIRFKLRDLFIQQS